MKRDWMTPQQAAKQWGITVRQVQLLCARGKIYGAERLGRAWIIPEKTTKPLDGRTKAAREAQKTGNILNESER